MQRLHVVGPHTAGSSRIDVSHLQRLMINNSGFAFDPQTGQTYCINHTGVSIIRWLNDGCEPKSVVARMEDEYGIDQFTASQDYEAFMSSLRSNALIKS